PESTPQPAAESTNYFQNTSGNRKSLRKRKTPSYLKDVFVVDTVVHKLLKERTLTINLKIFGENAVIRRGAFTKTKRPWTVAILMMECFIIKL
ncbi:Hypothetical predicted protein, partial [Olea europaea subsp. europaea]